jgi:signal transduction histidine kinase
MNCASLISPDGRRYLRAFCRALSPVAAKLGRRYRQLLSRHPYDSAQIRALLAIAPTAASRLRTLDEFFEQVEYNGRRLSKMNLPLSELNQRLNEFGTEVQILLDGRHAPAGEQLHLLTTIGLNQSYFAVREAEAQAFFGLYHAETEATDLDDLLHRLVSILSLSFGAQGGRLILLQQPPAGKLAHPLYIRRGSADESLISAPEMRGVHESYWSFPVRDSALIQLGFAKPYPWLPRELTLLHVAGERCHEAIERARIESELRCLQAAARTAEEEERRRIGRELHDDAAQSLLLVRLQLEMMHRDAPEELRPRLAQARTMAERTVEELRRAIAALSPAQLERLGLESALRQLAERLGRIHPARIFVRIPNSCGEVPRPVQEVIYRVAQESLNNIRKHSQATRINLLLDSTDMSIRLSVRDNGTGFDAKTALAKPMSFGLAGMRERAALLGGKLQVCSTPGKGATITLELPRAS